MSLSGTPGDGRKNLGYYCCCCYCEALGAVGDGGSSSAQGLPPAGLKYPSGGRRNFENVSGGFRFSFRFFFQVFVFLSFLEHFFSSKFSS